MTSISSIPVWAGLFPGQGALTNSVCPPTTYVDTNTIARVREQLDLDDAMWTEFQQGQGSSSAIEQPLVLALGVGRYRWLRQKVQLEFGALGGHSLGEYTALVCGGCMRLGDAISLVHRRGQIMDSVARERQGKMLAVGGLSLHEVEDLCDQSSRQDEVVVVANHNSASQIVVSGDARAVKRFAASVADLNRSSARYKFLRTNGAYHSPLMEEAAKRFAENLDRVTLEDSSIPLISGIDGNAYTSGSQLKALLSDQMTAPVRWDLVARRCQEIGVGVAIDFGPGCVMRNINGIGQRSEGDAQNAPNAIISIEDETGTRAIELAEQTRLLALSRRLSLEATCAKNTEQSDVNRERLGDLFAELRTINATDHTGQNARYLYDQTQSIVNAIFSLKRGVRR